jgi:hypothetical protein
MFVLQYCIDPTSTVHCIFFCRIEIWRPTYRLTKTRSTTASPPRSGVCATKLYRSSLAAPFSGSRFFRPASWQIDGRPQRLLVSRLPSYTDPATLHLLFGMEIGPVLWADKETNHDPRTHRLLVCALPSYFDPARLHFLFSGEMGRLRLQTDEEMNDDRRPHHLLVCALPI